MATKHTSSATLAALLNDFFAANNLRRITAYPHEEGCCIVQYASPTYGCQRLVSCQAAALIQWLHRHGADPSHLAPWRRILLSKLDHKPAWETAPTQMTLNLNSAPAIARRSMAPQD